jgi:hypothetical protein
MESGIGVQAKVEQQRQGECKELVLVLKSV